VAWLARQIPGTEVQLIDINPDRAMVAGALGVRFAGPDTAVGDADLVVHASGSAEGLSLALRLAGVEATVLELSWFGTLAPPLPLGEGFHVRRLTLRSSQVGTVAPSQRPRWDARRRLSLALRLLAEPALDVLITGESEFEALPSIMPALAAPGSLCHRIRYTASLKEI
jgi:threonine dehydrogenase-like Zn-dependent dehydrogenase